MYFLLTQLFLFSILHFPVLMMKLPIPASLFPLNFSQTQTRTSTRTGCQSSMVVFPAPWRMPSNWRHYSTSHTSSTEQLYTLWWDSAGESAPVTHVVLHCICLVYTELYGSIWRCFRGYCIAHLEYMLYITLKAPV